AVGACRAKDTVGERRSRARLRLDDDLESAADQPYDRVRDECHSALAWLELPRDADAHHAILRSLADGDPLHRALRALVPLRHRLPGERRLVAAGPDRADHPTP